MGREDQVEEREVLESIFPEEITGMRISLRLTSPPSLDSAMERKKKMRRARTEERETSKKAAQQLGH